MSPKSASTAMRIIAIINIISAILFALAATNDFTGGNELFFKLASSGDAGINGIATQEAKLAMSIAGGVFAGFSAFFLLIIAPAIKRGDKIIKQAGIWALIIWFTVDSTASYASGNAPNVILNIGFFILFIAPIILAKDD